MLLSVSLFHFHWLVLPLFSSHFSHPRCCLFVCSIHLYYLLTMKLICNSFSNFQHTRNLFSAAQVHAKCYCCCFCHLRCITLEHCVCTHWVVSSRLLPLEFISSYCCCCSRECSHFLAFIFSLPLSLRLSSLNKEDIFISVVISFVKKS